MQRQQANGSRDLKRVTTTVDGPGLEQIAVAQIVIATSSGLGICWAQQTLNFRVANQSKHALHFVQHRKNLNHCFQHNCQVKQKEPTETQS